MVAAAWNEVGTSVRAAVTHHVGPVLEARDVPGGKLNDLAVVLHTADRPVFVKGVEGVGSRRMRMLRTEPTVAPLISGLAPAVVFTADVDDWLLVGFEYVPGRSAVLEPGSPDLLRVAGAVNRLSTLPAPGVRTLRRRWSPVDWWSRMAAELPEAVHGWDVAELERRCARVPELVDGDRLVHTDLHGAQFLLDERGTAPHVIDWGYPAAGAGWVDSAFLVLRLVEAGHTPEAAEAWARDNLQPFAVLDDDATTAWAAYIAGMWSVWAATEAAPGQAHRAKLARRYAWWRLH